MGPLPRPDIPPGAQRDLLDALHDLHHRAGWPSLRTLAREAGCSHTTVSNVFSSPRLPTWGVLELLVDAMEGDGAEFHRLWLACGEQVTPSRPTAAGIAGRRNELAVVRRHLETGTGLLLVTGEAGIGKTKLVTTAATRAEGFVATGACRPLSTAVPLLPVADLLRNALRAEPTWFKGALDACPAYVPIAIGTILPELETAASAPVSDEWARHQLFTAVSALLAELGKERPLGVLLEDAHWADPATLDLLELLGAQDVPLVATVRTADPDLGDSFSQWLTRVRRLTGAVELTLGPLTLAETAHQLGLLGHRGSDPTEAASIHARSLGQPLFTEQLALHPDDRPLPELLADLLTRRLHTLTPDGWIVARALGVADRPLTTTQLTAIIGVDPVPALRELDARRLLAPADGPYVQLRHPLIADAVRNRFAPGEAADVHRQVATTLSTTPDPPAAEIADHWAAAGSHDHELTWRITAARGAAATHAVETAARQWQRVLELWPPGRPTVGDLTLAGAYIAALDAMSRWESAATAPLLDDALRAADGASAEEAAALVSRVGDITGWLGDRDRSLMLTERAVAMYGDLSPSEGHVEALFELRTSLVQLGRFGEAAAVSEEAVTVARALGRPPSLKDALSKLAWHQAFHGGRERAEETIAELTAIVLDPPDPFREIDIATRATDILVMTGAPAAELFATAHDALEAADTYGLHFWGDAVLRWNLSESLLVQGQVERAHQLIDPLTEGEPVRERWPLFDQRAILHLVDGRYDDAAALIAAVMEMTYSGRNPTETIGLETELGLAFDAGTIELWSERPADALSRATKLLGHLDEPEATAVLAPLMALAARAAADLGSREGGAQLRYQAKRLSVDPFQEHALMVTPPAYGALWTAELARLDGRDTVDLWVAAASAWDRLTRPFDAAYSRWRGAEAALRDAQGTVATKLLKRSAKDARGYEPLTEAIRRCGYPAGRG